MLSKWSVFIAVVFITIVGSRSQGDDRVSKNAVVPGHETGANGDAITGYYKTLSNKVIEYFYNEETKGKIHPEFTANDLDAGMSARPVLITKDNEKRLENEYGEVKDVKAVKDIETGQSLTLLKEEFWTKLYDENKMDYHVTLHGLLISAKLVTGKNIDDTDNRISSKLDLSGILPVVVQDKAIRFYDPINRSTGKSISLKEIEPNRVYEHFSEPLGQRVLSFALPKGAMKADAALWPEYEGGFKLVHGQNPLKPNPDKSGGDVVLHWWPIGADSVLTGDFFGLTDELAKAKFRMSKERYPDFDLMSWKQLGGEEAKRASVLVRAFNAFGGMAAWRYLTDGSWELLPRRLIGIEGDYDFVIEEEIIPAKAYSLFEEELEGWFDYVSLAPSEPGGVPILWPIAQRTVLDGTYFGMKGAQAQEKFVLSSKEGFAKFEKTKNNDNLKIINAETLDYLEYFPNLGAWKQGKIEVRRLSPYERGLQKDTSLDEQRRKIQEFRHYNFLVNGSFFGARSSNLHHHKNSHKKK
jgi:hypothetical protein